MPQLDNSIYQDRGVEGGIPNSRHNSHIRGTQGELFNASNTTAIPYGRFVQENAEGGLSPMAPGATAAGITVFNEQYEKSSIVTGVQAGIPPKKPAAILDYGELYVIAEVAVAKGDNVFIRVQNAGAEPQGIGRVRNDADGSNAEAEIRASFQEAASAGQLVRVFFDSKG